MDGSPVFGSFRHDKGGTAGEHQNHIPIHGAHPVDEGLLPLGKLHVLPVHALGFQNFVQAHAQQHHIRTLCRSNGFVDQLLVGLGIHPGEALGVARDVQARSGQSVLQAVQLGGVDLTGARSLISGGLGKVADDGSFRLLFQRQDAVIVQQDDGAFRALPGNGVVGILVKGLGGFGYRFAGGKHHVQQLFQALVHIRLADFALFYRFHKAHGAVRAGGGHHQVGACLDPCRVVIVSAPVGDHKAVKAPLLPKNFRKQMGVFVGIGAVYYIVAGHDGLGPALGDGHFKGG